MYNMKRKDGKKCTAQRAHDIFMRKYVVKPNTIQQNQVGSTVILAAATTNVIESCFGFVRTHYACAVYPCHLKIHTKHTEKSHLRATRTREWAAWIACI